MDPKHQTQIFIFFFARRHESSEGLDSSLAQSAAHLWQAQICPEGKLYLLWIGFDFVTNWVFEPYFGLRIS